MATSEIIPCVYEFSVERQLYVGEFDDVSGYIYLPGYFHFMSMGDQDLLASLGHPMWRQIDDGVTVPVVHTQCSYRRPLRVGTVFVDSMKLYLGNSSSFRVTHAFLDKSGGLYAEGEVIRCWVDMSNFSRVQMPEWFRNLKKES